MVNMSCHWIWQYVYLVARQKCTLQHKLKCRQPIPINPHISIYNIFLQVIVGGSLNIFRWSRCKGASTYDIRWLGGLVGSRKSDKIGYRWVGRSEEMGYPIFLGNFTVQWIILEHLHLANKKQSVAFLFLRTVRFNPLIYIKAFL